MHDLVYLHGFGETNPNGCPVAHALRSALPRGRLHAPCYHPGGHVAATRIGDALRAFTTIIESSTSGKAHIVGYSFGGLLAALLAERRPDIIANVLLFLHSAIGVQPFSSNYLDTLAETLALA